MIGRQSIFWSNLAPFPIIFFLLALCALLIPSSNLVASTTGGAVFIISIEGPISPASDDYLKTSLERAEKERARVLIIKLNTPGGLLTSMQSMVQRLLESRVPVVVYVSPSGGSAMSAGVFITLAGHVAAMSPGTTIGAAHPVSGGGQDIGGDMREKVENFAVSLLKAIAEQRGRDVKWAEQAVRESVAITDREALERKVIDLVASDLERLLKELNGRTVSVRGVPTTFSEMESAERIVVEMSFKQRIVNILADPNIAILLGMGALLGIAIELYHPGAFLPGIVGVICLILSLVAAQVLPINYGGLALFGLGIIFFVIELMMPAFGVWGAAGLISIVLGSIYLVDTDLVWGVGVFDVNMMMVGGVALLVALCLVALATVMAKAVRRQVMTGREGLLNQVGEVAVDFSLTGGGDVARGKVNIAGELWAAEFLGEQAFPRVGDRVKITAVREGLRLTVELV